MLRHGEGVGEGTSAATPEKIWHPSTQARLYQVFNRPQERKKGWQEIRTI